jgi:salicylate hydroxylase
MSSTVTPTSSGLPISSSPGDASKSGEKLTLDIAIIGGGIVGVVLGFGLLYRGIRVKIYERASNFHEIGAGLSISAVTRECMSRLSPQVIESMQRVASLNQNPSYRFWDGYNVVNSDIQDVSETTALLFSIPIAELKFWGCLRSQLLDDLAKALPEGVIEFGKQLDSYIEPDDDGSKVIMRFSDGSTAEADAIVGCDGIRSRVRELLFGESHPAVYPSYTHKACYRTVVPIERGLPWLGHDKGNNYSMFLGPNAHMLTYPVANWTMLNVVIFLTDPDPWPDPERITITVNRGEVSQAFATWGPVVRGIANLLPAETSKWGLFDLGDHPVPSYARRRICIAGDAAHASSPHLGAGAGFGIEDALALATALDEAQSMLRHHGLSPAAVVTAAFESYSHIRYNRTQWLVQSSREMGNVYEWSHPGVMDDPEKCKAEFESRNRMLWDFDIDKMMEDTRSKINQSLGSLTL